MKEINFRIETMINHFSNGNKSDFAKKIGEDESRIRKYLTGTEPKFSIIEKLVTIFGINSEWLITGKGSMLKSEQNQPSAGPVNDKYVAMLEKNNASLEKINALQEEKIAKLEADIKRLRGKEITAMEDKIELQRQQIQHLTSSMPSVSDTAQRKNLPRL